MAGIEHAAGLSSMMLRRGDLADTAVAVFVVVYCIIKRQNSHNTAVFWDVEVAYPWYPWVGQVVRVHGVIARPSGSMARCSLIDDSACRVRQFPRWMLDAAACQSMRQAERPTADLSAPIALRTLDLEVMVAPIESQGESVKRPS